jgi:hypothetical protein
MKIAISIPHDTLEEAERRAGLLGISRSDFFTVAARRYIRELDAQSLTQRINTAVDLVGDFGSSLVAVRAGHRVLAAETDEW